MSRTQSQLRDRAISQSLFTPTSLTQAFETLNFVQADPIRAPARAQDLILRHRVNDYRMNALEKLYHTLDIEEDFLYAYGFINRRLWHYLYPRKTHELTPLEKDILAFTQHSQGPLDFAQLETNFGKERVINAWGGFSQATKNALENLHYSGHLRIVGRNKGRRIYARAPKYNPTGGTHQRLETLIMVVANILAPVHQRTLQEALFRVRRWIGDTKPVINHLIKTGQLEPHSLNGQTYLWLPPQPTSTVSNTTVKFLAPFDPLVWDRRRFEQIWGWAYRFEAYTPPAKRIRGYYAMPLLWRDDVIGWANLSIKNKKLEVETGFVGQKPKDKQFKQELNAEIARFETFLGM